MYYNKVDGTKRKDKFLSMDMQKEGCSQFGNGDFEVNLQSERLHEPTSERQPADTFKKVRRSVRKIPNVNLLTKTPNVNYDKYENLVQSSTVSMDFENITKVINRNDGGAHSALQLEKKYYDSKASFMNAKNAHTQAKTVGAL